MKTAATFFVSYARADKRLAAALLGALKEHLAISRRCRYELWRDTQVLPGEAWREEIFKALEKCEFGLLLVSPAFLGSHFIARHELPRFLGDGAKPVIPAMLRSVSFRYHELLGLERRQIFKLDTPTGQAKAFAECRGLQRGRFVERLFQQIEDRLEKCLGVST